MGEPVGAATATRVRERTRPLRVEEIAWLALVPCALVAVAAIVVLGPPLGRAFFEPTGEVIPGIPARPEPTERARYALALLAPLLFALVTWRLARRRPHLPRSLAPIAVHVTRAVTTAFVVLCALTAYGFAADVLDVPQAPIRFFIPRTLAVAVLFALALTAVLRSPRAIARGGALVRERRGALLVCGAVATLVTTDWLLRAVQLDSTIGNAGNLNLIQWQSSESWAVLNGRTTLVDFHALYGHLWAYVGAASLRLFGATLGTWTVTMGLFSGLALLSLFGVLRRCTRSAPLALALYVPVLAMAWWVQGSPTQGMSLVGIYSFWPLRCGGPFLLAWLTARHLDGDRPRGAWALFLAAGLVLINNAEFGLGAFTGAGAALLLARPRQWARTLRSLVLGLLGAAALVSLLTLVRTGALPDFTLVVEFARLFGVEGWGSLPMPTFGLHLMLYATFVAAFGLSVVRTLRREPDQLLTGLLAYAGVFGLLAGSYYVGRSELGTLLCLFPTWILALVLLLIVVVRGIAVRPRLPSVAELSVMIGFGVAIAALPNTPLPSAQLDRLRKPAPLPLFEQPAASAFVAQFTHPGEHVAILALLGHRLAHDLGLRNVSPFSSVEAIRTPKQLALTLRAIRRARVRAVFVRAPSATIGEEIYILPLVVDELTRAGYRLVVRERELLYLSSANA